jgi:radical SAM protein with 4Fe4S-binding SPASM domain
MRLAREYHVAKDLTFMAGRHGFLAFSPPIPAWVWVNDDAKWALEWLSKGRSFRDLSSDIATREKRPSAEAMRELTTFLDTCPVVTSTPTVEGSQRTQRFDSLRQLWLCPSGWCNLSCAYCAVDPSRRPTRDKPLSFWIDVVQESLSLGASDFVLSGGEPTLYGSFVELVEWLDANTAAAVSVLTNGVGVADDVVRRLAATRVSVQVSLDGVRAKTHDSIRGRGSFAGTSRFIDRLREAGKQPHLSMTLCRTNACDLEEMSNFASRLGCESVRIAPYFDIGRGSRNSSLALDHEKRVKLTARVLRLARSSRIRVSCAVGSFDEVRMHASGDHCGAGAGIIAVGHDGGVYPCADGFQMPELCAGFVGEQPLAVIMRNRVMQDARGVSLYDNPTCRSCWARRLCGGICLMQERFAAHAGFPAERICDYERDVLRHVLLEET